MDYSTGIWERFGAITGNMGEGENGAITVIFRPIINCLNGEWLQLRSGGDVKKKKIYIWKKMQLLAAPQRILSAASKTLMQHINPYQPDKTFWNEKKKNIHAGIAKGCRHRDERQGARVKLLH